jgi:phosphoadenosine phosphosulfate reductase
MLIVTDRHKQKDLALWVDYLEMDEEYIKSRVYESHIERTKEAIREFLFSGVPHFLGTSWGKDSTVLAHMFLALAPESRIVFVRQLDNANPYSASVRDIFLKRFVPCNYEEIVYSYKDATSGWYKKGKPYHWYRILEELNEKYGVHVTGIRADESGKRAKRFAVFGMETVNSFAPFQFMTQQDIYGYLYEHDLPVHPNYAMLGGGRWERGRIRVAAIGNKEGDGMGRAEWEREYYPDVLARMIKGVAK